jgi:hypothetical protein
LSAQPTWEQFDALYVRIERAEAALAVAREREQRLREKGQAVVDADDGRKAAWESGQHTNIRRWLPTEEAIADLRAALVGEPAAAAARKCPNCDGFGKVRDSMRVEPVTCGRCDGHGVIPAAATLAEPEGVCPPETTASTESRPGRSSGSASAAPGETTLEERCNVPVTAANKTVPCCLPKGHEGRHVPYKLSAYNALILAAADEPRKEWLARLHEDAAADEPGETP